MTSMKLLLKDSLRSFIRHARNIPIRNKLIGIMLFQVILLTAAIGTVSYSAASRAIRDRAVAYSDDILSIMAEMIDGYRNRMEQYSRDILSDLNIYRVLEQCDGYVEDDQNDEAERHAVYTAARPVYALFNTTILNRTEIQSVALLDNFGHIWASDDDKSKASHIDSLLTREVTAGMFALACSREGRQAVYLKADGGYVENLFFVRSIYSLEDYSILGMLVIQADLDYLESYVDSASGGYGHQIHLYAGGGELILPTSGVDEYIISEANSFLDQRTQWIIDYQSNAMLMRKDIPSMDWTIVSRNLLDVMFEDIDALKRILLLLSLLSAFVMSFVGIILGNDLVGPIHRLAGAMERVRSGQSAVDVKVDRDDELGYLSRTFNSMARENEQLVKGIYREQLTRKDAELQALQSQINPHFLFNTLEAVSWMARMNDVPEISDMVENLSSIMEAGIGKGEPVITVSRELEYIRKFIHIMKMRYSDRLETEIHADESLTDYRIPKLLIQPLVENAVNHGIDKQRNGGVIRIDLTRVPGNLVIRVFDSGAGMPRDEVDMINEKLSMNSDDYFKNLAENQKHNIGLENVNRRIKLYYGEQYGISIESREGCYTLVSAYLPDHMESGERNDHV